VDLYSIDAYDYHLPEELIAQHPVEPRDSSRLMVVRGEEIHHAIFRELPNYLERGDLLVFNDTRVIRARLRGRKVTGGAVEALLLKSEGETEWRCLLKGKRLKPGTRLVFPDLSAEVLENDAGVFLVRFDSDPIPVARRHGEVPLPPYIRNPNIPEERYQTVFASREGAVAAPTAGLHFTRELLAMLRERGIEFAYVTLHVSYGTFSPVRVRDIRAHRMHEEFYTVPSETAEAIARAKTEGRRVVAVGTTVLRALEASAREGAVRAESGWTDLFIYPGYQFRSGVDALITNFHVPKSTLLMLVSAFGGYERVMRAYRVAVERRYRFFSFGDAMLLFRD